MVGLSPLVNAEHTHSTGDLSLTMTSMASGRFAPFSHAGPPRSLAKTSSFPRCYGVPFASAHALFNLSKLAVWWLRLGIGIERIKPGHPQQNGRHERMHLTLKKEATKPAARNFLQQQARFERFIEVFNNERPHEALDMKCPAEVYQPSTRPYTGLPDIDYPLHDKTIVVTRYGRICLGRKKINFSQVFAGQAVGIKEVHDDIWLVSFMDYDLGYFDLETRVLEPLENPFGPKVLPMS
jgi:putative transposase